MDSDEDYMSDKFLLQNNNLSSLPKRKQDERKHGLYKKKLKADLSKQIDREKSMRNAALGTSLPNDNKGFKMLQQMGYKPGTSLGKTNTGILEPIPVQVKNDNLGIGAKKTTKTHNNKMTTKTISRIIPDTVAMETNFRKALLEKKRQKLFLQSFRKAQDSCEYLDKSSGKLEPLEDYFWPDDEIPKTEDTGEESEGSEGSEEDHLTAENLITLINYLRKEYLYCIYCATRGTSEEDLNSFCPGPDIDDHENT